MFENFFEKFAADTMFQWHNMTFDVMFNILYTPCKVQKTLKNNR